MTPALLAKIPTHWEAPSPDPNWYQAPELAESLATCKAVTRHHATSFYFSSFPLPKAKKYAAFAVYALCRWVDDIIDEAEDPSQIRQDDLYRELELIEQNTSQLPFASALHVVNREYAIPQQFYRDLIEGCCMDRQPREIGTFAELEVYCYHVASVVGLMMSKIFGLRDLEGMKQAVEMGVAMQLTNILRDVKEDLDNDRVYLPREELTQFGLSRQSLTEGNWQSENWQKFMRFQIDRARARYQNAEPGLKLLENDGGRLTATLMGRVYGGILGAIEAKDFDVFSGRVYVPTYQKLGITLKALIAR